MEEKTVMLEWRPAENGGPALIEEPVLCLTKNKKLLTFKDTISRAFGSPKITSDWKFLKEKYNIEWWTYQNEIII